MERGIKIWSRSRAEQRMGFNTLRFITDPSGLGSIVSDHMLVESLNSTKQRTICSQRSKINLDYNTIDVHLTHNYVKSACSQL